MKSIEKRKLASRRCETCPECQMGQAVNRIISTLREGKPARLPGLGTLRPGKEWDFQPEKHDR